MIKLLHIDYIEEVAHCGECIEVEEASKKRWKCLKKNKITPELWGAIPEWCPLPSKDKDEA